MTFLFLLLITVSASAQKEKLAKTSAGFPVNYEEDSVGLYELPDLLKLANGKKIKTKKDWEQKRRPELLALVESIQFGKAPPAPATIQYNVFDTGTTAFNGKAIRKQVRIYLDKDTAAHKVDVLVYFPVQAVKPCPLLLTVSFMANNQAVADSGIRMGYTWTKEGNKIKADKPAGFGAINVAQFIEAGIGFATLYYGEIEPDFKGGIAYGIRSSFLKAGQIVPGDDEWGAIAAWSWGLSRVMDYFQQDKGIDGRRIAIQGASRLGKTALWAGIKDSRFKVVIASISGEGGAALSRRNYGENLLHITDTSRYYYQFAPNYHSYAARVSSLPFDAHALVALMAPRALLLQTGDTDYWSDPKGEFLAAKAAAPVYALYGLKGPGGSDEWPAAGDTRLLMHPLGYYMHAGGHTVLPADWTLFVQYLKAYL